MSIRLRLFLFLALLLNVIVLASGVMLWLDSYALGRQLWAATLIVSSLMNMGWIYYTAVAETYTLEKRVKIARLKKELADLGA